VLPDGAFYAWADCSAHAGNSWDFVFEAMREVHVALTPGRDFGRHGSERWLRLSYANSMAQLQEALSRLDEWLLRRA
jgi:aspartate/methionine/tyrosine aminotransferase